MLIKFMPPFAMHRWMRFNPGPGLLHASAAGEAPMRQQQRAQGGRNRGAILFVVSVLWGSAGIFMAVSTSLRLVFRAAGAGKPVNVIVSRRGGTEMLGASPTLRSG